MSKLSRDGGKYWTLGARGKSPVTHWPRCPEKTFDFEKHFQAVKSISIDGIRQHREAIEYSVYFYCSCNMYSRMTAKDQGR